MPALALITRESLRLVKAAGIELESDSSEDLCLLAPTVASSGKCDARCSKDSRRKLGGAKRNWHSRNDDLKSVIDVALC